jgi:hypothetical protein
MPKFAEYTPDTAPYERRFAAYGVRITVCANSEDLLAHTDAFLPPGWTPADDPAAEPDQDDGYRLDVITADTPDDSHRLGILSEEDGAYSVYSGTSRVLEGQNLALSLVVLDGQIRLKIAAHAPDHTFIHAGAVAHAGKALIMPGNSFAGKTTLTAALVRLGATYYSDEFAVLDGDGLLHPYAKPLSLRREDQWQVDQDVESLGGVAGHEALPIRLVALTYYEPGAHWDPRQLSQGEGALELLGHAVAAQTRPEESIKAIRAALDGGRAVALEGKRGEADETAELLLAALAQAD